MQNQTDNRQPLTAEQGAALVSPGPADPGRPFRRNNRTGRWPTLETRLADQALQACCGTFVTLKIDDQLRGCIGSLSATAPIVSGVRDNALNAAFHDPRFSPLSKKGAGSGADRGECAFRAGPAGLHRCRRPVVQAEARHRRGDHQKRIASATFLPQVWEQLPQPEPFLSHLCMKAGLPADQWREGDLTVLVYQVQYFEEAR
jgi:uncharacterized protein (TIGR00296 family)